MQDIDRFERLRDVGRLEQYSTARHQLKFYLNASVTATYTLPSTFTLPVKDYIYKACEILIGQHPVLSAIPVAEDTKQPYFVRLPEIDLDQSVFFQERSHGFPGADEPDHDLDAVLKTQHNTAFSPPSPYWRLCVLTEAANERRFTAVFVFHHATGDGTSGKAFHRTFLQALHDAATSLAPGEAKRVVPSPQIPLLPNVEAVHPMPLSIPFLLTILFNEKVWSWTDPGLWTGSKVQVPLETEVRHIVIPKSLTSTLKDSCRQNSTTITATVQTIVARSLFKHLPSNFTRVQCSGAMSTRRWLPNTITDDSMGVWVQDFTEDFTRSGVSSDAFPWNEAKRSRETIEKVLSLEGKNAGPNLLRYIDNFHEELFLSKVGKQRKGSYEVSNIGVMAVDRTQDSARPQIGRMVFSQSASVTGNAIEVSVVTGGDGCLVLAFSWQKNAVESDLISNIIDSTRTELHDICTI